MSTERRIRLLEADPDLGRFLTDDERAEVRALAVPVIHLSRGEREIPVPPMEGQAFGALVLDGMLLQRMRLAGQETMRLIGPGDVLAVEESRTSTLLTASGRDTLADTYLALLGSEFLAAARRWPGLVAGLHVRTCEQAERITAQLAICQLPRVADRLLAMMWLLAESWGRVTPAGVTLPLVLTHEAIGALIGARRPTVSLAITELVDRGAVVRQHTGWLLLEPLSETADRATHPDAPILLDGEESRWSVPPPPPAPPPYMAGALLDTVRRLRNELREAKTVTDRTLDEARRARERVLDGRRWRAEHPLSRRRAPSSGWPRS